MTPIAGGSEIKEILFHVGAHKTGTSLIQNSLKLNTDRLADRGLRYIHKYDLVRQDAYRYLMASLGKAASGAPNWEQARSSFESLVDATREPRILFSHENLLGPTGLTSTRTSGRMYPHARGLIERLQRLCGRHRCRIVVTLRNQPDFVESMYVQYVMSGKERPFHKHRRRIALRNLSWEPILDEIEGLVGTENLIVYPFERLYKAGPAGYISAFVQSFGTTADFEFQVAPQQNRSFSAKALRVALQAYPALDLAERRQLSTFLRKNLSNEKLERPRLLFPRQRNHLLALHQASNERIFARHIAGTSKKIFAYYCPRPVRLGDDPRLVEARLRLHKMFRGASNRLRRRLSG